MPIDSGKITDDQKKAIKSIHTKLEKVALLGLSREDLVSLLKSPFVETEGLVWAYAKSHVATFFGGGGSVKVEEELAGVASEVLRACVGVSCKVRLHQRLESQKANDGIFRAHSSAHSYPDTRHSNH